MRKLSTRQLPVGSSAVRALNALGNGTSSRPSTPTPVSLYSGSGAKNTDTATSTHGFLSHKLNKIMMDRQSVLQPQKVTSNEENERLLEIAMRQNGKNDSWQEDQEVCRRLKYAHDKLRKHIICVICKYRFWKSSVRTAME